jgi:indolepyruvate ferredoxin oxidoreductase
VALGLGEALPLSEAVARYLFKLMAYKDEYEVARLHSDAGFAAKVQSQFEGDFQLNYHLAPPLFAKRNEKGELQKQQFGAWMGTAMRLLAKLKYLRGTAFDVFGRSEERRDERALIVEYRTAIDAMLPTLNAANRDAAAAFARVPEQIRGFGHVKARHLEAARQQWALLQDKYHQPQVQRA